MLKRRRLKHLPAWIFVSIALLALLSGKRAHALDWNRGEGFRYHDLKVPENGRPGFTNLSTNLTRINFVNRLSKERYTTNQIYLNGSGVAAGDYDGDGLCDLFFCGLDSENKLYRNLGGFKFEDVSEKARVRGRNIASTGATFADVNGNGRLDLLINSVGQGTWVLLNAGDGTFRATRPINLHKGGMSMALADVDGDSDLDLYVTNYRTSTIRDEPGTKLKGRTVNGKPEVVAINGRSLAEANSIGRFTLKNNGKIQENGQSDGMFLNDGKGRFAPVSFTGGMFLDEDGKPLKRPMYEWGLSSMFRDMNQDGRPDLYVCNDFESPDRIWINQGKGVFRLIDRLAIRKSSHFSMGVDFSDINRDGFDDFIVADMLSRNHTLRHTQLSNRKPPTLLFGRYDDRPQYSYNTVYLNRGDETYSEIGFHTGLAATEWSWSPVFMDVDLDGYEDFLITTGHPLDMQDMDVTNQAEALKKIKKRTPRELLEFRFLFKPLNLRNLAFRNVHGMRFVECSEQWGFDQTGISHGMALADLDNDGDLDIAVNNFNHVASVYRNNSIAPRISLSLRGQSANTAGIGARILIHAEGLSQSQEIVSGGRYLSGDQSLRTFAATKPIQRIIVDWPSGRESVVESPGHNRHYVIYESGSTPPSQEPRHNEQLFADASALLNHTHADRVFDDFSRQQLLPKKLSQEGPGVAWVDWNMDGLDDIAVTTGVGGKLAVFLNEKSGGFKKATLSTSEQPSPRDQLTLLQLRSDQGGYFVLQSNYEDGLAVGATLEKWMPDGKKHPVLAAGPVAYSTICSADYDGDGDLDIFVGGRCKPGAYPMGARSVLLRNDDGSFTPDQSHAEMLSDLQSVSGAIWTNLTGDHLPELVLACDPGTIKVFLNEGGKLTDATSQMGLGDFVGFWNSVNSGDFNGDGKLDLICGNIGTNSRYEIYRQHGLAWHYGDISGGAMIDVLESYHTRLGVEWYLIRPRHAVLQAMPFLGEMFPTYTAYASATASQVFGERISELNRLEIKKFKSVLLLNKDGRFEAIDLPPTAQHAPVYGITVADFNGDGHEDAFLAQNFFGTRASFPRMDAGRGLLLEGKGTGQFTPMSSAQSGIFIYGDQRGSATADYNGDARPDLLVGQNSGATKLYRNMRAKRGVAVQLAGQAGNQLAIGARIRLKYGKNFGPVREIRAGGGYRSQDSATQILGIGQELPDGLTVAWPSGKTTEIFIPDITRKIQVSEGEK